MSAALLTAEQITDIGAVSATEWNALTGARPPFMRHEFLAALEHSGTVGPGTGWQPAHLLLRTGAGGLAGAMPLYLKTDSWGEFVFDFAWADAYRRAGLRYYPKLVCAVPFTPATGPRLLVAPNQDPAMIRSTLLDQARMAGRTTGCSSLHLLFPEVDELEDLRRAGLLIRKDCQFHWHNHGYASFDGFLAGFTAEKRKKARRERRRIAEAGISFQWLDGHQLEPERWERIMPLYASTFWRRGREPYLPPGFFAEVSRTLPDQLRVVVAMHDGREIAAAICFLGDDTLYGRYWGADGDYHSLHFETCYYQGIEYCIEHGIERFEPGTQGEHKVSRGFVPSETWSAHWLAQPQFLAAVDDYLRHERRHVERYMAAVDEHLPYRRG
ncbi:MAG: N-acetyltransferase [Chromatiales bacterium]|nr:N-acetyltransferase [Chromatiales bacterium]